MDDGSNLFEIFSDAEHWNSDREKVVSMDIDDPRHAKSVNNKVRKSLNAPSSTAGKVSETKKAKTPLAPAPRATSVKSPKSKEKSAPKKANAASKRSTGDAQLIKATSKKGTRETLSPGHKEVHSSAAKKEKVSKPKRSTLSYSKLTRANLEKRGFSLASKDILLECAQALKGLWDRCISTWTEDLGIANAQHGRGLTKSSNTHKSNSQSAPLSAEVITINKKRKKKSAKSVAGLSAR